MWWCFYFRTFNLQTLFKANFSQRNPFENPSEEKLVPMGNDAQAALTLVLDVQTVIRSAAV